MLDDGSLDEFYTRIDGITIVQFEYNVHIN